MIARGGNLSRPRTRRLGHGAPLMEILWRLPDLWTRKARAHKSWNTTELFCMSFHRHSASLEGDISIELRTGTFLTSLDTERRVVDWESAVDDNQALDSGLSLGAALSPGLPLLPRRSVEQKADLP